jgi:enamine deaminase RidA (YjgF/YER057c/UK114 family)
MAAGVPVDAPDGPRPEGGYAQAVRVEQPGAMLFISGQIPVGQDGFVPGGFAAQAAQVWANIDAQLRAGGMTKDDLVKATVFLSDRSHAEANRAARAASLGDRRIALTVVVADMFDPAWLLEIEAVAAR